MNINYGTELYMLMIEALKNHCEDNDLCKNCIFQDIEGTENRCLFFCIPENYQTEKIRNAIREQLIEEERKNGNS